MLEELQSHCVKRAMPPEIQKLGRTIRPWFDKICNFHLARVSNGPTESLNNLIKRIKRIGFGFRNFKNYRIRALLYAGKPNWRVLGSIVVQMRPLGPRQNPKSHQTLISLDPLTGSSSPSAPLGIRTRNLRIKSPLLCR